MDRRTVMALLGAGLLLRAGPGHAQPRGAPFRIGFLAWGACPAPGSAFLAALRELGYVEGTNAVVECSTAAGIYERLPAAAAELVRRKPDVIVGLSHPTAKAARDATGTIPIVMASVADPIGYGLVPSLSWPGGNVTGLSSVAPELAGKRLELLKEAFPRVSHIAVMWTPAGTMSSQQWRQTQSAARLLRVRLRSVEVEGPDDLRSALAAMRRERPDALLVGGDPVFSVHGRRVMDFAEQHRLPAMYAGREFVEAGGLMSYGPSHPALHRRAAAFVDRILQGARAGDLPVEQPTQFELVINLGTARALGLAIPQPLLQRADQVIR